MVKEPIDTFIDGVMARAERETDKICAEKGQVTLGELVARLEAADPKKLVEFDDGKPWKYPGEYGSYRGYYRFIAVEHSNEPCTVADFLKRTKEAIGATFEGYKGGVYLMTKHTPVWVSEYGMCSGVGIIDVDVSGEKVILKLAQIED